eukprot:6513537-Prymnesium_polylepis.1
MGGGTTFKDLFNGRFSRASRARFSRERGEDVQGLVELDSAEPPTNIADAAGSGGGVSQGPDVPWGPVTRTRDEADLSVESVRSRGSSTERDVRQAVSTRELGRLGSRRGKSRSRSRSRSPECAAVPEETNSARSFSKTSLVSSDAAGPAGGTASESGSAVGTQQEVGAVPEVRPITPDE